MKPGPHIFDNAMAELESEVIPEIGTVELEQGPSKSAETLFGVVMIPRSRNAMLIRFGFLPGGAAYIRVVGMDVDTGDQVKIHALETETGAFIETD